MSSEERLQRGTDAALAALMAPSGWRYVLFCSDCRTVLERKRDSSVVKRAREDGQRCSCGGTYYLARDAKADE